MGKRILSGILCICILLSQPLAVHAQVSELITRPSEQNGQTLARLKGLESAETEAAHALLNELGLLDENGELNVSENVTVNGESFPVSEVIELTAMPNADLSQIVEVEGIRITLGELKTIVEIENELARIKERYFSGREMSEQQLESLDSLVASLERGSVTLLGYGPSQQAADAPLMLDLSALESSTDFNINAKDQELEKDVALMRSVVCENCLVLPANRSVSFTLRLDNGLLPQRLFTYKLEAFDNPECSGSPIASVELPAPGNVWSREVVIGNGSLDSALNVTLRMSLSKVLPTGSETLYRLTQLLEGKTFDSPVAGAISGTLSGRLTFCEPQGCVFRASAGGDAAYVYQKAVNVSKNYAFFSVHEDVLYYMPWNAEIIKGYAGNPYLPENSVNCSSTYWPLFKYNVADVGPNSSLGLSVEEEALHSLQLTAAELYGTEPLYKLEATTILLHSGYGADIGTNDTGEAKWVGMLPVPTDHLGSPIEYSNYQFADSVLGMNYSWLDVDGQTGSPRIITPAGAPPGSPAYLVPSYKGYYDILLDNDPLDSFIDFREMVADGNKLQLICQDIPYALKMWGTPGIPAESSVWKVPASSITKGITKGFAVSVYDETAPTLVSVTAPAGSYASGQLVPVKLVFSEPIKGAKLQIMLNSVLYDAVSLQIDTTGKTAVAWYEVKDIDSAELTVNSINNVEDLHVGDYDQGNIASINYAQTLSNVVLESALMRNAVEVVETRFENGVATINLRVRQDEAYKNKYKGKKGDAYRSFKVVLTDSSGISQELALTLAELQPSGELFFTGRKSLVLTDEEQTLTVGVRAFESAEDSGTHICESGILTVPAKVKVTGVSVVPEGGSDERTLDLSLPYRPTLKALFTPDNATYKTVTWSSSDTDIATISDTGEITLTGNKAGEVTFWCTADNGTTTTVDDVRNSIQYTVEAGESPALVLPEGSSTIITRQNALTKVLWSSNVALFADRDINYTVKVYAGNYATVLELFNTLPAPSPIWQGTVGKTENSIDIPAGVLANLSSGMTPAYCALVSTEHPTVSNATLNAIAHIVVNPVSAKARLSRPASIYLLDNSSADVGWSIENFLASGASPTEAKLEIWRVEADAAKSVFYSQSISSANGNYTLIPLEVPDTSLKETYMVMLSAKNQGDEVANVDSFPVYVYNSDALSLEYASGGALPSALSLDNSGKVWSYTAANQSAVNSSSTQDLLALREELGLIEYIGINSKEYSWSQLADRIRWQTSNPDVTVNYKQSTAYENIALFDIDDYLPQTKMAISSIMDGTATITATHANTGMRASVNVNISTLREKFFLFQFSPAIETAVSYTDGAGIQKTVKSNADGVLALYEPNRIASDVALKAVSGTGDVYLGTIYKDNLLSGERDATKLAYYPLNSFRLRQVAKVELMLNKPDGTPFSGELILRGGVYINGAYCQDALMSGTGFSNLTDGKDSQIVTVTNGALTVWLDSTQFWSAEAGETSADAASLSTRDNIRYIFELSEIDNVATGVNVYLPMLAYVDGNLTISDVMRSAESVLALESAPGSGEQKPFMSNQFVDYGLSGGRLIDVKNSNGRVGPSATYRAAVLKTVCLLWGKTSADFYTVSVSDDYNYTPPSQTSRALNYPFSSIPAVENALTLTEATMTHSGWIADGDERALRCKISKAGAVMSDKPMGIRVIDMTRVPGVEWSDTASSLVENVATSLAVPDVDMSGSGVTGELLEFVVSSVESASGPVNLPVVKMLITPGADNSVFNAFVWAGYNGTYLPNANYSQNGIAVDSTTLEPTLGHTLEMDTIKQMTSGEYFDKSNFVSQNNYEMYELGRHRVDPTFNVEGYYEFELRYDPETQEWEAQTLGGGFQAGIGIWVNYVFNGWAGPVPVTAEFNFRGAVQLSFKAATLFAETVGSEWSDPEAETVTEFLTTLRLSAYLDAFGGFGFDYTLLALKVGLFGRLSVDNNNRFLSREYLKDASERQLNGQQLHIAGEVGVRFAAKVLFITYTVTLGSGEVSYTRGLNDWNDIDAYWTSTGRLSALMRGYAAANGLVVKGASTGLSSRGYLTSGTRVWDSSAPTTDAFPLQTNANPDSFPRLSDNGELLVYVNDQGSSSIYDSRVFTAAQSSGGYSEGAAIADPAGFEGFGDSSPVLDGNGTFAAAAWVRMRGQIPGKDAGDPITAADIRFMTNSTEIAVSVWNGSAWTSSRLTNNATPDLAPVVAVNENKALVVWRAVYAADPSDITDFSAHDTILYSIYDSAGGWSPAKMLYNGSSGAVTGLDAAMLADGTAAVTYALERDDGNAATSDSEIAYTLINTSAAEDSRLGVTMLATSDAYADENPQIIAVRFGSGDERFVLGWYSVRENGGDIRLLALNGDGAMSNAFPESIAEVSENVAASVGADFSFADMSSDNSIERLSIVYSGQVRNATSGDADHSTLNAIRLHVHAATGTVGLTAPFMLAELPARTLLDHTDAYVSGADGIKAVLQGTWYDPVNNDTTGAPLEETKLFLASGSLSNAVNVAGIGVDFGSLALNTLTPIQFTVLNSGLNDIDSVTITLDGTPSSFDGLSLAPNESVVFTCWYNTGSRIQNLDYSLSADFVGGPSASADGTVYLDYPDLGISQMETIKEDEGTRTVRLTLYNGAAAKLAGASPARSVHLGFYTDSGRSAPANVRCATAGVSVVNDNELVISGFSALSLIDSGACTVEVIYDVGERVSDLGLTEIPSGGLRLYARVWGVKAGKDAEMPEYEERDNYESTLFESLVERSGERITLESAQSMAGTGTTAQVSVRNNSLQPASNGTVVATLLDTGGNVLESQQLTLPNTLHGEQIKTQSVAFSQDGSRVLLTYGTHGAQTSSELSALTFDGLPVRLSNFTANSFGNYSASLDNVLTSSTLVSYVAESSNATVTINGAAAPSGTRVSIPKGDSSIEIEVVNNLSRRRYTLSLNRPDGAPSSPSWRENPNTSAVAERPALGCFLLEASALCGVIFVRRRLSSASKPKDGTR